MQSSRRDFLKLAGVSALGLSAGTLGFLGEGAQAADALPTAPHRSNQIFCPLINKTQKPGLKLNSQQVRIYIQNGFHKACLAAAGAPPLEMA